LQFDFSVWLSVASAGSGLSPGPWFRQRAHRLDVILVALDFLACRIAHRATALDFLHHAYKRSLHKVTLPKACDLIRELARSKREGFR
jgi:hypothetical protein